VSRLRAGKDENQPDVGKFRDYFDYAEAIRQVPSHRALAVFRGRALEVLDLQLALPRRPSAPAAGAPERQPGPAELRIGQHVGWRHQGRAADDFLLKCVSWTWRVKLSLSTERDLFARLRDAAHEVAIKVFADNVRDLLLAAPAGPRVVMGLDPGIRTGVKVAVVDATGKLVDTATVYPHEPRRDWEGACTLLRAAVPPARRGPDRDRQWHRQPGDRQAGGRSDAAGVRDPRQQPAAKALREALERVVVSEAGASVYSASAFASEEMPEVDVSLRGAASIAGACRIRWPSWSRSTRSRSVSASTSTT
jgi:uncharacterized protein